jgi:hypothetical protein
MDISSRFVIEPSRPIWRWLRMLSVPWTLLQPLVTKRENEKNVLGWPALIPPTRRLRKDVGAVLGTTLAARIKG